MSITQDINLLSMWNRVMLVAHRGQSLIDIEFIGENLCSLFDVICNDGHNGIALDILNRADFQLPAALHHSENRRLAFRAASACTFANTAEIRLVCFDFASKEAVIFGKHGADLLAHSPSRLIRNTCFALNLLGRNSAACLRHEINHIEPNGQGSRGLVEDSASS